MTTHSLVCPLMRNWSWIMDPLASNGHECYVVGGTARDLVMNRDSDDVDFATSATPDQVRDVFKNRPGYKLYPTGVDHGTWSIGVRGADEIFEVTSFRKDVATDGRRAVVEFATTMEEDAQRRDFTINALYIDRLGRVYDPTGLGLTDAENRLLRFVGSADDRCREDYLRILRLFRFSATLPARMEITALEAAAANAAGLKSISGERIWSETKKMLASEHTHELQTAIVQMLDAGVNKQIFPIPRVGVMQTLFANERLTGNTGWWQTRYAAIYGKDIRQPCSKTDSRMISCLAHLLPDAKIVNIAHIVQEHGISIAKEIINASGHEPDIPTLTEYDNAVAPFTSRDFEELGYKGAQLGEVLRAAKAEWYHTNLKATREELVRVATNTIPLTNL